MATGEPEEIILDNQQLMFQEKANELLNEGRVLDFADEYLENYIVKEHANRKVLYLALLNKNQILIRGASSQGKTHVAKNVLRAIPKNRYDDPAGFSAESPKYYFETIGQEIDIIFIPELEGRPEQNHVFRYSSQDDGGGKFIISEYDQEEKKWMPRIIETGVKTILSTSVHINIDSQDLSRAWILYPDPSVIQTKGICEKQADDFVNADKKKDFWFEQQVLWEVYEDLRKQNFVVVTPFYQLGKIIEMPFHSWFMRRENPRIIGLISNIARINYRKRVSFTLHQKVKGEYKDVHYLIANLEDIYQALSLLNDINSGVSTGLNPTENKMLELVAKITSELEENRVGTREVLNAMIDSGWEVESQEYAGQVLRGLYRKGFLFREKNPYDKRENLYNLSGKKRDFVKIHYEELQPTFEEWLEERDEVTFQQIVEHPIYPELLGNLAIPKEAFSESLLVKETDKKEKMSSSEHLGKNSILGNSAKMSSIEEIQSSNKLDNNKPTKKRLSKKKEGEVSVKKSRVSSSKKVSMFELLNQVLTELEMKSNGKLSKLQDIISLGEEKGLVKEWIEHNLEIMRKDGFVIEPKTDYYKKVI